MLRSQTEYMSLDAVQTDVFHELLQSGQTVRPRHFSTVEITAASFTLLDPRNRCIYNTARKWSLPLALGELSWHLSGSRIAEEIAYYAPAWSSFADMTGRISGSCYGSKIFGSRSPDESSQWSRAKGLLRTDQDTRRAMLIFADSQTQFDPACLDAACATSLQFLIRRGKLDAVVCMRSNDAVWGLPYDVFLFTFLQEVMALELGVDLGSYHHFAASLHLYERHIGLAQRALAAPPPNRAAPMPPIVQLEDLSKFLTIERAIREGATVPTASGLAQYWRDLVKVLKLYRLSKALGWEAAIASASSPGPYLALLLPLMESGSAAESTALDAAS